MSDKHDLRPDPEMERDVSTWLSDSDLSTVEADLGLDRVLDQFPVTPQTRRRFLGRWLDRDEGAGRRTSERDHPPDTNRRNRLMLTATGVTAAIAILALSAGVSLTDDAVTPAAQVGTHVVAADGSGDYATITEAVDVAADGDTVLVQPGTYTEAVVVDKDLTIMGDADDPSAVVVRIPDDAATREFPENGPIRYGFWFEDAAAELANLTIQGPSAKVSALVAMGGDLIVHDIIEDLDAYTSWPYGFLYAAGDASGEVFDNTSKALVAITEQATPTLRDNTIHNVIANWGASSAHLVGNDVGGIWTDDEASPVIQGNDIDYLNNGGADGNFSSCGIQIIGDSAEGQVARPTVIDNTVRNATTGICVNSVQPTEITGNTLIDNPFAISLVRSETHVRDNDIAAEAVGISISGEGSPTIEGNTIDVAGRGISIGAGATPTIEGNTICGGSDSIYFPESAEPTIGENDVCEAA